MFEFSAARSLARAAYLHERSEGEGDLVRRPAPGSPFPDPDAPRQLGSPSGSIARSPGDPIAGPRQPVPGKPGAVQEDAPTLVPMVSKRGEPSSKSP
jgi:hypothetical protein